jgi:fatty acid desaturase
VADTTLGRLVSFTLLHEPYHGVHHLHAGVSHAHLSRYVDSLMPTGPDELPPFPSYRLAFLHLLGQLRDPKVGAQWQSLPSNQF